MLLNVESVKPTSTGKSLIVKAGGKDYFAKTGCGIIAGTTIDAETKDSLFNGKTNTWIEKWRAVQNAAPQAPDASASSSGRNGVPAAWLPFASNTVAHAISAGLCSDPMMVKAWAAAAKQAYEELTS